MLVHRQLVAGPCSCSSSYYCSCSFSCFLPWPWTQKYLVHGLQSECCQKWENMCVKLLKMFLAAYPVSKRSYFSCHAREGEFTVSASLTGTNIFEINFLNLLQTTRWKPSSHSHLRARCGLQLLAIGIPGEGQMEFLRRLQRHLPLTKVATFLCRLNAKQHLAAILLILLHAVCFPSSCWLAPYKKETPRDDITIADSVVGLV